MLGSFFWFALNFFDRLLIRYIYDKFKGKNISQVSHKSNMNFRKLGYMYFFPVNATDSIIIICNLLKVCRPQRDDKRSWFPG